MLTAEEKQSLKYRSNLWAYFRDQWVESSEDADTEDDTDTTDVTDLIQLVFTGYVKMLGDVSADPDVLHTAEFKEFISTALESAEYLADGTLEVCGDPNTATGNDLHLALQQVIGDFRLAAKGEDSPFRYKGLEDVSLNRRQELERLVELKSVNLRYLQDAANKTF